MYFAGYRIDEAIPGEEYFIVHTHIHTHTYLNSTYTHIYITTLALDLYFKQNILTCHHVVLPDTIVCVSLITLNSFVCFFIVKLYQCVHLNHFLSYFIHRPNVCYAPRLLGDML
jgi:hypothetical protein